MLYNHDEDSRVKTIQKPTLNVNDLHELCIVLVLWRFSIELYIYIYRSMAGTVDRINMSSVVLCLAVFP